MSDVKVVSKDTLKKLREEGARGGGMGVALNQRTKKSKSQIVQKKGLRKRRQNSMFDSNSRLSRMSVRTGDDTSNLFAKRGVNMSRKSGMADANLQLSGETYDGMLDQFNTDDGAEATLPDLRDLMEAWAKTDYDSFSQFRAQFDIMKLQSTIVQWYITHPKDRLHIDKIMVECSEKHGENKTLPPRIMQQYNKVRTIGKEYKNLQDLIEKSEEGSDEAHKELEKFLVYYRKYTKPIALLNCIIRDYRKTLNEKSEVECLWLLEMMFHWIYIYIDEDFRTSEILSQTRKFVEQFDVNAGTYHDNSISDEEGKKVINLMDIVDLGHAAFDRFPSWRNLQPETDYNSKTMQVLADFSQREIADILHDFILEAFQSIRCKELIDKKWDKNKAMAPSITTLTDIFNNLNHWVKKELLEAESLEMRNQLMEKFIKIMKGWIWPKNDKIPNYHGAMAIHTALRSDPIFKLKDAWKRLKPSTASTFEKINNIFKNDSGQPYYKRLRYQMEQNPGVLFMGVTQSDLTFLYDSMKSKKKRADQNSDVGVSEDEDIRLKTHGNIFNVIYRVRKAQMYIIRQDSNGIASGLLSVRGESAPLKEAKTMAKILEKVENQGDKRVVGNMRPEEKRKLNIARRLKYEMGEAMKWGEVEFYEAMQTQRTQDREDAKPGCLTKFMECFPSEVYLVLLSFITMAEVGFNVYVLSIWVRNSETFWVLFTISCIGMRLFTQLGVVYATDYTMHLDEEAKEEISGQRKNTFYGKAFTIFTVILGLGVPRAAIRLWKENTSEELEVDETITTKTSNSKLEFSRLHAAQMFESLPLMYLQIYFLNWKSNISGDQFWLVGASIFFSILNVSIRFGQIVRAQLESFFRYQKKESQLVLVVWGLVASDLWLRPAGPLLCAVDSQEDDMLLASCYAGLVVFFSLFYCIYDFYQHSQQRASVDSLEMSFDPTIERDEEDPNEHNEKKKRGFRLYDMGMILFRVFFMSFTMTPHFVYTDTEYLPQFWVVEQSIRIITTLITVLFLTRWYVSWVVGCTCMALLHVGFLYYFIGELTQYNEMKKSAD